MAKRWHDRDEEAPSLNPQAMAEAIKYAAAGVRRAKYVPFTCKACGTVFEKDAALKRHQQDSNCARSIVRRAALLADRNIREKQAPRIGTLARREYDRERFERYRKNGYPE